MAVYLNSAERRKQQWKPLIGPKCCESCRFWVYEEVRFWKICEVFRPCRKRGVRTGSSGSCEEHEAR